MRKIVLFFVMFGFLQMGWAQNKKNQEVDIVSHTVQMGETVRMLSKKYLVDPSEIYKLNKFAVDGIHQGDVLQIPVPRKEPVIQQEEPVADAPQETTQEAPQQETQQPEPVAEEKPKPQIPKNKPIAKEQPAETQAVSVADRSSEIEHTVAAGETLYSLSKKYGVSVDEIKMNNGGLKKGLQLGQTIRIPAAQNAIGPAPSGNAEAPSETKTVETKTAEAVSPSPENTDATITHQVAPKETLYSLSKKYGVTVDDIKNQNPDVAQKGLQIGQTLTIRKN